MTENLIVVAGAQGQIGRSVCDGLARDGFTVVGIDNLPEEDFAEQERAWRYLRCNLTEKAEVQNVGRQIFKEYRVPDALVNFAHYKGNRELTPGDSFFSDLENYPRVEWDKTIEVNLTGLLNFVQVFGTEMAELGRGSIVTVSSTYGLVSPTFSIYGSSDIQSPISYATTKAGIIGFTRYLAGYWGPKGIRTNCLAPGGVGHENQDSEFRLAFEQRVPLGRMATTDDYLGPIRFLVSSDSCYMNGAVLSVDGGWTAV